MASSHLTAPTSLARLASFHAARNPAATALRFEGEAISYGELAQQVDRCAALLRVDWGLQAGDRVAWLGLNHPGQLLLLLALARLGAALLPLNFRLAPSDWIAQLRECGPVHLVHDPAWAGAAAELGTHCGVAVHPAAALAAGPDVSSVPDRSAPDAPLLLVYTSGTTGRPRAAVHTQANLLANMRIAARAQALKPDDSVLTVLPLFHVGGLCIQTLPALHAGASVMLHARFGADATLAAIAGDRPSLTLQVPATMQALVEHPDWKTTDLTSLRAVWAGSSLLPSALVQAFLARGVPLCNVYGSTESGPFSIALAPPFAASHAGSCGWPAPGVEVRLASAQAENDGYGTGAASGELLLRAPNVARHYWPEQPACDADGWLHTGDLATRAADGSYTVVGRVRDLIISGGENIHPLEIEDAAAAHPAVAECAAFGLPHPQWGEAVALAVVLRAGAAVAPDDLRRHMAERLARFKLPREVFVVDSLPRTALGKLQRGALAAMLGARVRSEPPLRSP